MSSAPATEKRVLSIDPTHRGLLQYIEDGRAHSAIFSAEARVQTLGAGTRWQQLAAYVREGVWHIWLGFDHILFLLSLLLITFLSIVPVGLIWAQFEHVSLRKVAAESEHSHEAVGDDAVAGSTVN